MTDPVLYEERDDIANITINRPEKKNALTEAVIQGIEPMRCLWDHLKYRICFSLLFRRKLH